MKTPNNTTTTYETFTDNLIFAILLMLTTIPFWVMSCFNISDNIATQKHEAYIASIEANEVAPIETHELLESRKYITYGFMLPGNKVILTEDAYNKYLMPIESTHPTDGHIFNDVYDSDGNEVTSGTAVYVAMNDHGTPSDMTDDYVIGVVVDYYAMVYNIYDKLYDSLSESLGDEYNIERVDSVHIHISEK